MTWITQMDIKKLSTDDTDYTDGSELICDISDISGEFFLCPFVQPFVQPFVSICGSILNKLWQ